MQDSDCERMILGGPNNTCRVVSAIKPRQDRNAVTLTGAAPKVSYDATIAIVGSTELSPSVRSPGSHPCTLKTLQANRNSYGFTTYA